jgi:hypothetical protein
MHTKGCNSELSCKFCHLCGPNEHKLRKKKKIQLHREANKPKQESQLIGEASESMV